MLVTDFFMVFYGKSTDFMVKCHFFMAGLKFYGFFWFYCKVRGMIITVETIVPCL